MDIASLRAFVSVADYASFSQAAEQLKLTQPAVSKRIATLEHELAEKLFDRIGRKVILTEAGATILPKCRSILEMVEDTQLSLSNLSGQVSGRLRLGTSHHIGLHHLPPVISKFSKQYPEVDLDLHFMDSEKVCDKVIHGDLELGIVTLPIIPLEHIASKTLWTDTMSFVAGKQHKLADESGVTLHDLVKYNAILPNKNTYTREIIEQAFSEKKLPLKTSLSTNYLETIKMMVTVGLGWSILPDSMVDEDLCVIRVPGISLKRELGYVQHQQRTLSNAAIAMMSVLTSSA